MNKFTIVLGCVRISLVSVMNASSSAMRYMMNTRHMMNARYMVDDWMMHNDWCMSHNHGTRVYNHGACPYHDWRGCNIGGSGDVSWLDIRVNPDAA